jgi:hypothetical protein
MNLGRLRRQVDQIPPIFFIHFDIFLKPFLKGK